MDQYGFIKLSLVDYPREVSSVIFFPGCNFKCSYCHNLDLVHSKITNPWTFKSILEHLSRVKGKLITGVCITGGEPTLQTDKLLTMIDQLKKLDLKVKLDTNGSHPDLLRIVNVDYVAMDLKTSLDKYRTLSTDPLIDKKIIESINIIKERWDKDSHEFRTTMFPPLTTNEDLKDIEMLKGHSNWTSQKFKIHNINDKYCE